MAMEPDDTPILVDGRILHGGGVGMPFRSPAIQFGVGLYESFSIRGLRAPQFAWHMERLAGAAAEWGLDFQPRLFSEPLIRSLAATGDAAAAWRVRLNLLARDDQGACIHQGHLTPLDWEEEQRRLRGVRLVSIPDDRGPRARRAKTIAMMERWRLGRFRAPADEHYLWVDERGQARDSLTGNLMMLRDGVIVTPPVGDILPGVVRRWVMECSGFAGGVIERPITVEELQHAGEVWLTGSVTGFIPVREVNGAAIPSHGQTALVLREQWLQSFASLAEG
ncbi:MAG: hypothetical protein GMKNLPBB_01240 [Myxococcota bacterium]|nr:hypothetical protein [Myxococcota bacterium]